MTWMSWQIDYLLLLQNFRTITHDCLDQFFLFTSQLGIAPFILVVMCIVYWAINKKTNMKN